MATEAKGPEELAKTWSIWLPSPYKIQYSPFHGRFHISDGVKLLPGCARTKAEVFGWRFPVRVWCHILKRHRKDTGDPEWHTNS